MSNIELDNEQFIRGVRLHNVSDADLLEIVNECPRLESLSLMDTSVTSVGISHLAALSHLKTLEFAHEHRAIDQQAIGEIGKLSSLERLGLRGTRVDNDSIAAVAGLKNLSALDLSTSHVSDAGLAKLLPLRTTLKELNLSHTRITDACMPRLMAFSELKVLDVSYTKLTDDSIRQLSSLSHLQRLSVPARTNVSSILSIAQSTQLTSLTAWHMKGQDLTSLLTAISAVENLDLRYAQFLDEEYKHLQTLHRLEILSLADASIDGSCLRFLSGSKSLRRLYLSGTKLKSRELAHLTHVLSLEYLDLTAVNWDDAEAAVRRMQELRNLKTLIVSLPHEQVMRLRDSLSDCQVLSFE